MTRRHQVFRADWVVPVAAKPIRRGEVLIDPAGLIAGVAPVGALELPADILIRDLGAAVLLPGLVNAHAHPELTMFRGALEDLPFRDWILRLVGARRTRLLEEDSGAAANWAMVESIAAGITTMGVTEASGASVLALTSAGLRGIVYQEVFGPDPVQVAESMRVLEDEVGRLTDLAGERVRVGISPHAPYTVSDDLYRAAARLAIARDLPVAVHIAESRAERDLVVAGAGDFAPGLAARGIATPPRARSPIDLLDRLGVLDARPLLIHCVDVDESDIEAIARAGCAVAHCPVANAKLGHGAAPLPKMLAAGVTVGLGTDSVASNNRVDLLEEARFASLMQRGIERRFDVLPADALLRLCTIDGARALRLDDRIGTLEPGKQGDLCGVRLQSPSTQPTFDPVVALFHSARGADVALTVVGGDVIYEEGEFRTIDLASARAAVWSAAARVAGA